MTNENKKNDEDSEKLNIGSTIKKLFTAGLSQAFMTEESLRSYLQELKLPKELLQLILSGANKSKEELMDRVAKEFSSIMNKIDFIEEMKVFIENHKIKISAEVDFIKKPQKEDS